MGKVYQVVLQGNYHLFDKQAMYWDKVMFTSKDKITNEYIEQLKADLLDGEKNPLKQWSEVDYITNQPTPIRVFIRAYEVL